ncbi:hypothetical protein K0U27_05070 [archaeon]|nr:hypothetical protein [archaeon]
MKFLLTSILSVILITTIGYAFATTEEFEPVTNSQPNETQFLDSHGNAVVIRHHVFEAGKQVKMQNEIHGVVESGQKGTWEMFTYDLKSEQVVETVKILDVDLQHNTSKSFEWDVVFTKKGIFSFVSRITYTDPNISAAFDSDIAVVDRLSKTYAENN